MTTAPASPNEVPPILQRSSAIAGACAAVFAVALFLYAGGTWQIVLHELLSDGIISLAWIASAFGIGAMLLQFLARRDPQATSPHDFTLIRYVTAVAMGLGMMSLLVLALGMYGVLNRATAIGLLAVGFIGCGMAYRGKQFDPLPQRVSAANWIWLIAMPFLAIAVMSLMLPPGSLWQPNDPHGYDVVSYHLQIPREWFEAGRIMPLQHNVFSYFPFNVEMHYLLAMHIRGGAWSGMYLAQMMHLWFIVLTVIAIGSAIGPVAGAACATLPWLAMLGGVAYNEGGLLLFGTLAFIWAIEGINTEGPNRRRAMLIAGLLAGFACGSKYTGAVVVAGGVAAAFVVVLRQRAAVPVGLFVVGTVITFAPWLIRNIGWAGNPVFPEAMPILGRAHFSDTQAERWSKAHSPTADEAGWVQRLARARERIVLDWQYGYILLPAGVIAIGLSQRNQTVLFLAILLLIQAIFWLGFTHLQSRFFVAAIPIAALLAGGVAWRPFRVAFAAVVVIGAIAGFARLHATFMERMENGRRIVGLEQLDILLPVAVDSKVIPETRTLLLVGDAAAFYYPMPMSRLRYRTVFDVDAEAGQDAIQAWTRGWPADEPMLIMPSELVRFSKTYWGIPAPSAAVGERPLPYLVRPAGGGGTGSP